jgi:probable HAF family extracellular repeat protein
MFHRCALVLSVVCLAVLASGVASATPYLFADLGTLGGTATYGYGMNDAGQVAGASFPPTGYTHGYVYSGGTMNELPVGSLRGAAAWAINSGGQIVGNGDVATGLPINPPLIHPMYWSSTSATPVDLGLLPGAGVSGQGYAYAINSSGRIVGQASSATGYRAFLSINGGALTDLGTLGGGTSYAWAVNNNNVAFGRATDAGGTYYAVSFDLNNPGTVTALPNIPTTGVPWGANDAGWVVGSYNPGALRAIVWSPAGGGTMTDLGALFSTNNVYSRAYDINNNGIVVGYGSVGADQYGPYHAFMYDTATGIATDLNNLTIAGLPAGLTLEQPRAINDAGQIAGFGRDSGGVYHAFRLTPAMAGDANLDGTVNITDLSKVLTNYDAIGKVWADGDFNGDGTVNISDLSNVLTNYDKSYAASAAGIRAVPEPGMLALLACGLVGVFVLARRR